MRILVIAVLLILTGCSDPVPTEGRLFSACQTPILFWWAESDGSLDYTQDQETMRRIMEQLDEDDVGTVNWCPQGNEGASV